MNDRAGDITSNNISINIIFHNVTSITYARCIQERENDGKVCTLYNTVSMYSVQAIRARVFKLLRAPGIDFL